MSCGLSKKSYMNYAKKYRVNYTKSGCLLKYEMIELKADRKENVRLSREAQEKILTGRLNNAKKKGERNYGIDNFNCIMSDSIYNYAGAQT